MKPDTRALRKLKRKYSKNPEDRGVALIKKLLLSYLPGWLIIWVLRKYFVKSDYKAARESGKFFEIANFAYGARNARKAQHSLIIALRLLGENLPMSYISTLHTAIATTLRDPTKRSYISDSILLRTKEISVENLDASHWYQLSRGLFSLGYFRAAWVARENSLDQSVTESLLQGAKATVLKRCIEAKIERGIPESDVFPIRDNHSLGDSIFDYESYFLVLNRTPSKFQNAVAIPKNFGEQVFHEMITNHSVAIVGPSPIVGEYGKEIDDHDIVIRIKYAGKSSLPDKKFLGKRCDANYYGDAELASILKLGSDKFVLETLTSLKIVLTSRYYPDVESGITYVNLSAGDVIYRSNVLAGLRVLFSVLRLRPRKVKVFGFDFYASKSDYHSDQHLFLRNSSTVLGHNKLESSNLKEVKEAYRSNSLFRHDPVSNFCFAQNLYKAGLFEIEPYGKSILELTPYQYVERLEEMLGDW